LRDISHLSSVDLEVAQANILLDISGKEKRILHHQPYA
jgi:hypothetical protein